jgi:hypothetical protein
MTISTLNRLVVGDISTVAHHVVTIFEADDRHGRFEIKLADGSTLPASRTPLLAAARYLIGEGANPDALIEMCHASKPDVVAMSGRIGTFAKLDVHETPNGPRFRRWEPPPSASIR